MSLRRVGWTRGICHDCVRPSCQECEIHRFRLHRAISRRSLWEHAFDERTRNHKGNVAEADIAAEAIKLGVPVLKPLVEHTRYDLVFDLGQRLLRVQCKWAPLTGDVVSVNADEQLATRAEAVRFCATYIADEIDAVAVYCEDSRRVLSLPGRDVRRQCGGAICASRPPGMASGRGLNWASRLSAIWGCSSAGQSAASGTPEAVGSSPTSSTLPFSPAQQVVGAHDFRNRFGWYMERAAAGEEFFVTRRGKPYVRLLPARDQLDLDAAPANGGSAGP